MVPALSYDNIAELAEEGMFASVTITAADFKAASEKPCGPCITFEQHKVARPSLTSDTMHDEIKH